VEVSSSLPVANVAARLRSVHLKTVFRYLHLMEILSSGALIQSKVHLGDIACAGALKVLLAQNLSNSQVMPVSCS